MKVHKSSPISPFGGLNFVLEELDKHGIGTFLQNSLPSLPSQSQYSWRDILYSFWSVFFCGGDCAEDLGCNLHSLFTNHPNINAPSPDRVLNRLKELATSADDFKIKRSSTRHSYCYNAPLLDLNIAICKRLFSLNRQGLILDYDNTLCHTDKKDATLTYKSERGYQPGVAFIGNHVVYLENRSGRSTAHVGQHQTLQRMFSKLEYNGIKIDRFRADSASYNFDSVQIIDTHSNSFYIRARMSQTLEKAISKIKEWQPIQRKEGTVYMGETLFTPFVRAARDRKAADELKPYRLIVVKQARKDGQINFFTQEACLYSAIVTNDFETSAENVLWFYNQRGAIEKEFEVLKYDFGWNKLPFSYMEQNNVYMLITAMCKNIYTYIIELFSGKVARLQPHFRVKKFIFRFICIPAKWIYRSNQWHLRLYGSIAFQT